MVKIILVNTNGTPEEFEFLKYNEEDLYKKCNFRKKDNFEKRHTWNVLFKKNKINISVWARDNGRANHENKYELPRPIDTDLYFGKLALVATSKESPINLTIDMWTQIYNGLMGGFEDLTDTALQDENESDELDAYSDDQKTDHGFLIIRVCI